MLGTVDSWKGCNKDSSLQKNPRSYGCAHKKRNNIGNPTVNKNAL